MGKIDEKDLIAFLRKKVDESKLKEICSYLFGDKNVNLDINRASLSFSKYLGSETIGFIGNRSFILKKDEKLNKSKFATDLGVVKHMDFDEISLFFKVQSDFLDFDALNKNDNPEIYNIMSHVLHIPINNLNIDKISFSNVRRFLFDKLVYYKIKDIAIDKEFILDKNDIVLLIEEKKE